MLNNSGTITDNGTGNNWQLNSSSALNNLSGGVIDMNSADEMLDESGTTGSITNQAGALFEATGGSNTVAVPFSNQAGTIDVSAGTLSFTGGGTQTAGTFNASSGATLNVAGLGTWAGTFTGSGGGTIALASGSISIGTAGATFDFPAGLFNWSGGAITPASGGGPLSNTGTITLTGSGGKVLENSLVLNNSGTITDNGTASNWQLNSSSELNNLSGGVIDMNSADEMLDESGTTGSITNQAGAIFEATGGSNTVDVPFNNQAGGIITVTVGTLSLSGGGTDTGGTFNVALGTTLNLTGGSSPTLTGTYTGGGVTGLGQGTVSLASGTLNIGGTSAIPTVFNFPTGLLAWSGGAIADGVLDNTGTITLTGSGAKVLESSLVLNNSGTITDNGTGNNWQLNSSSALNNLSGGVIDMNSADEMLDESGTTGSITNQAGALFEATGGSNTVAVPFSNQAGTIDVSAGTLSFTGGGTQTAGTFNASSGATLNVAGLGTWAGTFTGSGGGTIALASGSISIGTAGATFDFPAGMFNWSGGAITPASGGGPLSNTGTITLTGSGGKVLENSLVLNNSGTIIDNGTASNWQLNSSSELNNLSGGVIDMNSIDEMLDESGAIGSVTNQAGAIFEATDGSNTVDVPFSNQGGTIDVTAGTLNFTGGGADTGGSYNSSAGATINLNNGGTAPTLTGTYIGSGDGIVALPSGTLKIGEGGATFDFPAGLFQWSGGAITPASGGGPLSNTGTITLTGNGAKVLESSLVLNNSGTITDNGTNNNWQLNSSSELNNLSGGVIDMNSADEMLDESGTTGSVTNQAGAIFEATGGSNTVDVPFNNQAGGIITVTVGTLSLSGGGTDTGGTFNVALGTTLNLTGGSSPTLTGTYTGGGVTGLGQGTVSLASGTLSIGTTGATFDFPAGLFNWSGGAITPASGGGPLSNTGTITLTGSGGKVLENSLVLNNSGTITDNGTGNNWQLNSSSELNNLSGGVIDMNSADEMLDESGTTGSITNQAGAIFEATDGSNAVNVPFNNTGTALVTTGTLSFTNVTQVSGTTLTGGTWEALNGSTLMLPSGTNVITNDGNITLGGPGATIAAIKNLANNVGSFSLLGGETSSQRGISPAPAV